MPTGGVLRRINNSRYEASNNIKKIFPEKEQPWEWAFKLRFYMWDKWHWVIFIILLIIVLVILSFIHI